MTGGGARGGSSGGNKAGSGTIFMFYGEGGHRAEMESLLSHLLGRREGINCIGLAEGSALIATIVNHRLIPMRSKYVRWLSLFLIPPALFYNTAKTFFLMLKYRPKGLISTGPGSVLFPAVLFKIFRKKIVYIENCSRFETKSLTGKYMYLLADRFYVQSRGLLALYPKAVYAGML